MTTRASLTLAFAATIAWASHAAFAQASKAARRAPSDETQAWAQFRGPGSSGVAPASARVPLHFGPDEHVAWKVDVPAGHASPIVVGDHVYLSAHKGTTLHCLCFDAKTGRQLWQRQLEAEALEEVHDVNSQASSTPVSDGQRVIFYFGSFGLLALDTSGNELWRRRMQRPDNIFGSASSPILAGSTLLFHCDQNAKRGPDGERASKSWLEAMDAATGKTRWRVDRSSFVAGWSTPVVWRNGDVDEVLVYGSFRLVAYDLRDGSERWSVPGLADEPCITPVMSDGVVYVTSYNMRTSTEAIGLPSFASLLEQHDKDKDQRLDRDEASHNKSVLSRSDADGEGDHPLRMFWGFLDGNRDGAIDAAEYGKLGTWLATFQHANALVAIRPGDGGERRAELLWQYPRGVPECPSPLVYGGRVYMIKNGGLATCVDAAGGKLIWQGRTGARGPHYASPILVDGRIYCCSARGEVAVLRAGDELEVLAVNELDERIMASPAVVGTRLFVRTAKSLWCFEERA